MKTKLIIAAMALLAATSFATGMRAGTCEDAMASYAKHVAEDAAEDKSDWAPGVKENIDKMNAREKANILKGCAPGGFYDQLDEAMRQIKAICLAHPDKEGC
jgi:hypothetical protein